MFQVSGWSAIRWCGAQNEMPFFASVGSALVPGVLVVVLGIHAGGPVAVVGGAAACSGGLIAIFW